MMRRSSLNRLMKFFSDQPSDRFNITHKPVSDKDIVSASPLHADLRTFSWFLLLVCHLQAGTTEKWSPSSQRVLNAKKFITSLIQEKLCITIDVPSVQGELQQPATLLGDVLHAKTTLPKIFCIGS